MKIVFVDTEVTGEHAKTTLVSVGMATLDGQSLYVTFNDYARDQVTKWLEENVLSLIDETKSVSSEEAFKKISSWLEEYSDGEEIRLVSAGLGADLFLLFELYKFNFPERDYFHALHCLPDSINHGKHMDLNTLFQVAGYDPGMNRSEFAGKNIPGKRHDALYDALVVRECFMKLLSLPEMRTLASFLEKAA